MGDDTWDGLFPNQFFKSFPFPSFNVKDLHTVDNGILQHLIPTVEAGEWDVLIAHFLGVDHCGHRYGPDHPAMADKLHQMDEMIRSVLTRLQNDTLLVVLGDHGMTNSGDHGGDSEDEVNAALFLYSPLPLFGFEAKEDNKSIPQIDIVPTLALLLGIPIPYSNIGKVIADVFSWNTKQDFVSPYLIQAQAHWLNARQVDRFLETYSLAAKDLPKEELRHLKELFFSLSSEYSSLVKEKLQFTAEGELTAPFQNLITGLQHYLKSAREMCQKSWARFHPRRMLSGIVILVFTLLMCYLVSGDVGILELLCNRLPLYPFMWGILIGILNIVFQLLSQNSLEFIMAFCWATGASLFGLFWQLGKYKLKTDHSTGQLHKSQCVLTQQGLLTLANLPVPLMVLFFRCASLFSNSFVVADAQVVLFLLKSLVVFVVLKLFWSGMLTVQSPSSTFIPEMHKHMIMPAYRKECFHVNGFLTLFFICVYLSSMFHSCREELLNCEPSSLLTPLSSLKNSHVRNICYILCITSVSCIVYLIRWWLRHYGNLNSSTLIVLFVRWGFPLTALSICLYWAMCSAPYQSFGKLQELVRAVSVFCPRIVYGLTALGLFLVLRNPIMVFVKDTKEEENSIVTSYKRTGTETDLLHVIPQIYRKMHKSLSSSNVTGADGKPTVAAYGLGTVYSAVLLTVTLLLGLLLILLHSERLSLSFLILFLEAFAFLQIHSIAVNLSANDSEHFSVNWYAVIAWAFASWQFFYSTGHQPTLPTIQWNAAFVGFNEGHDNNTIPALLILANTFASYILFAVSCPLLLFWPFIHEIKNSKMSSRSTNDDQVMEMRLRESPERFAAALLQLGMRYLFAHGIQLLASVCAAALLRRHLMVWKIFAPKFLFEAVGFVVTSISLLFGISLVIWVDNAVNRWFKKLILSQVR
ncbi:GPI ethanolamine phosphate transferase 3 isoform X2 [Protopterus annectens]|nr:GPI ethanolamine phosphate transferase 3 isoform X2 [Protopterus annectens]